MISLKASMTCRSKSYGCLAMRSAGFIKFLPAKAAQCRVFDPFGHIGKPVTKDTIYVIDSLPIAVCDNIRIRRSKIYSQEDFRGYQASKKRYFYGLKIHLTVTPEGQPVECFLTPGGFGDVDALQYYAYDLPDG